MTDDTRILISGAGPVGLTMAIELTRYGVPIRIVDKAASRTDKSKALVIWSRTLELLDRAGLVRQFLDAGQTCHGTQFSNGPETIARVSFDSIDSPYPFALMIPQSETERILETHLKELGVAVERQVELTGFAERDGRVLSTILRPDDQNEVIETQWLVGCDGAHSAVRHGLGMSFEGSTQPSDWALADVEITGLKDPDRIAIFWHSDGILAVFPISDKRFRVIADLGPAGDDGHHADPTLDDVQALVDRRGPGGIVLSNPIWLAAFRINERKVRDYGRGRVFLAGDAAHIHSPAGGQGMNTGMQDAFNLSWKLAMVARGTCKPSLLESYSPERSAVGDVVLRNASRMTDAAVLRNPIAQAIRNKIAHFALDIPQVQHRIAQTLAEVEIAYLKSPLSVSAPGAESIKGGPAAGERWPPIKADVAPVGSGSVPGFTLVGEASVTESLARQFPALVVGTGTGPFEDVLWLVRPDGYVGLTARSDDVQAVRAYLEGVAM
ncbi:FAD-dependent monooxygenase [Microvirga subterranea]|uniref:2-polyprenyl-6-methoxyphenol hydroxylase-like FAD-dependent oxidoreductase n=1 Tax=Microvirga subterranea TaxID=186651 RepID=A0A370HAA4_9HYPH|nr:FAD-dependent monooxygenase [Microvirga subterranea]RDI53588.1 2-polyprenyl-6-methoxyphenol hydroxylase-like FAD-dependent oxidoreductase [Microvirga subterranea]